MFISLYHHFLLTMFIILHNTEWYLATGVDGNGCLLFVKIVCRYSPVWKFVNWDPILAYISDASNVFIILHSVCKATFRYGISLVFPPLFSSFVPI